MQQQKLSQKKVRIMRFLKGQFGAADALKWGKVRDTIIHY